MPSSPRRSATAARNRRQMFQTRIQQATTPTRRLWALVAWLQAEARAAPAGEQRQVLASLMEFVSDLNRRRQQ